MSTSDAKKYGKLFTYQECSRCQSVLNEFSGPNCSDSHAMTCCGEKSFHKTTCENIKQSAGYKAGQRVAEEIEKRVLGIN